MIVNIAALIDANAETAITQPDESDKIEVAYNVTGNSRKELIAAVGEITGWKPVYKGAPSFAFAIGNYPTDKNGTLTSGRRRAD